MVVAFVLAFAAVALGELDAVALDLVDDADMDVVGADHLGMFLDLAGIGHVVLLGWLVRVVRLR